MRKGKMISQGAHASMKVILDMMETKENIELIGKQCNISTLIYDVDSPLDKWINGIFTKIVVSVNSEEELLELYNTAKEKGLPCSLIEDVGLTEFHGVKTATAIAIGPDNVDEINKITGHLPLL